MKHFTFSILFFMMLSITNNHVFAQSKGIKTDTITVSGNCGQCKERIEEAAYLKGVKKAEWNKSTKVLTVIYNPEKTDLEKISLSVAKAGHDSKGHAAAEKDYKQLPECCAYRSGICHHD